MEESQAHIVSHTEKRTRLHVVSSHRNSEDIEKFVVAVKNLPCVDKVKANVRTGSILIFHQGGTRDQFKGVFEDIGCILQSSLFPEIPRGEAKLSLPQAIEDLDARLSLIHSPLRFSHMIPFSLGILAFVQMRRQGVQLTTAPWYVLAYLAYYTYTSLNRFDNMIDKVVETSARSR